MVAYRQVAGNYRTAVESIARILPERMKHCRFEKALHLVAMGCLYADMDETTLIESDDEYCLVETGGDIYEMLETGIRYFDVRSEFYVYKVEYEYIKAEKEYLSKPADI